MQKGTPKLHLRHCVEELNPFRMKAVQERKRWPNSTGTTIGQLHPIAFFVGLDRGMILRQGPLEANDAMQMAICDVVCDLANGPVAIERIELLVGKVTDRLA